MIGKLSLALIVGAVGIAASTASAAESSDVAAGRRIFEANCAMCHGTDAGGMMGMHPSLRGAVERLTLAGVEVAIRNGRDTNPPMPAFAGRLTDQEIDNVIAYINSLAPGPRNFGPQADSEMMDGMMGSWMLLVPALIMAMIVAAAFVVLRVSRQRASARATAREILDRRYAQGELTRDEYLERRNDLGP